MLKIIKKTLTHPALAIGSTVLWGVLEFAALQRSYKMNRMISKRDADERLLAVTDHSIR